MKYEVDTVQIWIYYGYDMCRIVYIYLIYIHIIDIYDIYIYTYLHTHIYVYIIIYLCIYHIYSIIKIYLHEVKTDL